MQLKRFLQDQLHEGIAYHRMLFIPLFLASYLVYSLFSGASFPLDNFSGRPVSIATFDGIDIRERMHFFYLAFLIFLFSALVFSWLIRKYGNIFSRQDLEILNSLSLAGFILMPFLVMEGNMRPSIHLILSLMMLAVAGACIKIFKNIRDENIPYAGLFGWLALLSVSIYFIPDLLRNSFPGGHFVSIPVFILFVTGGLLITLLLKWGRNKNFSDVISFWQSRTLPLAFIPLLSVAATELCMICNQRGWLHLTPAPVFLAGVLFLMILVLVRKNKDKFPWASDRILSIRWLPVFITGYTAFGLYQAVVSPEVDLFEDANHILPLQQWFSFGKIPFIDTFSSHALSDFLWGGLYSFFNGRNAMGGYVYSFLLTVLVSLVIYHTIVCLTGNAWKAVFLTLFFPFTAYLLPPYFNFVPVTLLLLITALIKRRAVYYFLYFISLAGMIVWRIDLGVANLGAGLLTLFLAKFLDSNRLPDHRVTRKGLVAAISTVILVFVMTWIAAGKKIFVHVEEVLGYMNSLQAYGRRALSNDMDVTYFILYYILPAAVIITAAAAILRLVRNKEENGKEWKVCIAIIFFSLFFLFNFQRGLIRHTLYEQWDTALTSYGFLIPALGFYLGRNSETRKGIRFFSFLLFCFLIIVACKFERPGIKTTNPWVITSSRLLEDPFPDIPTSRVDRIRPSGPEFSEIKNFLDRITPEKSTFLDFSNTPMMYYFTNRELPDYFCQIPHTAHNDLMQERLLKNSKEYNIPIVIFSNYPAGFWDQLDDIPNTLRHYRIAEYIYNNYHPYTILDGHTIWKRNDVSLDPLVTRPVRAVTHLDGIPPEDVVLNDSNILRTGNHPLLKNIFSGPVSVDSSLKYFLNLELSSDRSGILSCTLVSEAGSTQNTLTTEVQVRSGNSGLFIPLYLPSGSTSILSIQLQLPANSTLQLRSLVLSECTMFPDFISKQAVESPVGMIPFIWGNYDPDYLKGRIQLLSALYNNAEGSALGSENTLQISIPQLRDKSHGNYIRLRARSTGEAESQVIMHYGEGNTMNGGFIFSVLPGKEEKDYLIRISSQYNWMELQNNWLSFYPMREGIKISKVDLLQGD
ncbi:MAG: hypothetical protein IT242_09810 [Bacteroidia bacterium]|nr:hypothetical protein [Bacteroidia bacterium]